MERYAWLVMADSCGSGDVARARKEDVGMGWEANGWGMYSVEAVLNARYVAAVPRGRKKEVLIRWAGNAMAEYSPGAPEGTRRLAG